MTTIPKLHFPLPHAFLPITDAMREESRKEFEREQASWTEEDWEDAAFADWAMNLKVDEADVRRPGLVILD